MSPTNKSICTEIQEVILRIAQGDATLTDNETVKAALHSAICAACTSFITNLPEEIPKGDVDSKDKNNGRGAGTKLILR